MFVFMLKDFFVSIFFWGKFPKKQKPFDLTINVFFWKNNTNAFVFIFLCRKKNENPFLLYFRGFCWHMDNDLKYFKDFKFYANRDFVIFIWPTFSLRHIYFL